MVRMGRVKTWQTDRLHILNREPRPVHEPDVNTTSRFDRNTVEFLLKSTSFGQILGQLCMALPECTATSSGEQNERNIVINILVIHSVLKV